MLYFLNSIAKVVKNHYSCYLFYYNLDILNNMPFLYVNSLIL